jgi:uncharacterized protein (TIGR02246 family)
MQPDEQAIRDVHAAWIAAVNAGELGRLFDLMADDVVFLGPGQAPFGRDGFRAGFSSARERLLFRCTSELQDVQVVGDVATTVGRDSLSLRPRDGGDATALAGHRLTVYRRQSDGRWLLARDAHTLSPGPA